MSNNEKKKGNSWFANFTSGQDKSGQENVDIQVNRDNSDAEEILDILEETIIEETKEVEAENINLLSSKDGQDKVVLDVIVSLENMIKDRELLLYKNRDINNQLLSANETISHMKEDLIKNDQLLMEKNKQILGLKNNLTNKQMTYDQLLEDYREYQTTSSNAYEKISVQLDGEVKKYDKLNEEFTNIQYQNMSQINKLEEKLRNLQVENKQYEQQYKKVFDEKTELLNTINAFTEQMSFSLSPKVNTNSSD